MHRRKFLKRAGTLAGAALLDPVTTLSQAPSDSLKAYPYAEVDRSDWPRLNEDEENLLSVRLSAAEAKALMSYKINHGILENKAVLENLRKNHNIDANFLKIEIAKGVMNTFYNNVIKEFDHISPWNTDPKENEMTVGNVMDRFWKRASAHVHIDDIQMECRKKQGKSTGIQLGYSYPLYLQILGAPEKWRGNIPLDEAHINIKDDNVIEDIARRQPSLNFPKIFEGLGIPPETVLIVTPEDLKAIRKKSKSSSFSPG